VQLSLSFDAPDTPLAPDKLLESPGVPLAQDRSVVPRRMSLAPGPPMFVRHKRARRFILRVLDDGRVRVTLPRGAAKRDAQAFLDANADWVDRQRALRAGRRTPPRQSELRRFIDRWYRRRAERDLPRLLLDLARAHDIHVARVLVRDQRSRWGACSSRGTITLNWRLLQVPAFVREYVLLHELMHRRELNHSRRFWRLVAACCPRHREARQWLRTEGKLLWPSHA
jgi:predicted metal-dependent hydrolase